MDGLEASSLLKVIFGLIVLGDSPRQQLLQTEKPINVDNILMKRYIANHIPVF